MKKYFLPAVFLFFISCSAEKVVDVELKLAEEVYPVYPARSVQLGQQGNVKLLLLVDTSGAVKDQKIGKSSGYKSLDSSAVAYAEKLKFEPVEFPSGGKEQWVRWTVKYEPTNELKESVEVGEIYNSEKETWADEQTGYQITRWTSLGENWHLYFNIESFIDDLNAIIYSDRGGSVNLYKLNLISGDIVKMTDEDELHVRVWHLPQFKKLWFRAGDEFKELNTETYEVQSVFDYGEIYITSFSVTCDAKYIVYGANKNPGFTENNSTGPYALFRLDLTTKEVKQISPDLGFKIGHVQCNPVDPTLISYCWQHVYREGAPGIVGNAPIRIWWNNIHGTDGGPVGLQEFGLHRTHEFWYPDGKRIGYSARYRFGENEGEAFLGSTTIDGKDNFMMPAPVWAAHSQLFKNNRHWVADHHDGPYIVLFSLKDRKIVKKEILFEHGSSWKGQRSHPHPHFSPDGKYVLFSSDKSNVAQVYTVKVDIGER